MKKIFSKLHLWLSFPFGIIISVLCLTGGLLVFETEIQQVTNPERFYVNEVKESTIPLEELIPIVHKQLPDTVRVSSVTFPPKIDRTYRMGLTNMGRTSLIVDPYTGKVVDMVTPYAKGNFFSGVRRLHRWFMYPMQRDATNWGKMLTGTATLIFVFILITGIIIWVPRTITMLKRRLKIKVGGGKFRFWYDLHLAGGIYMAIILLAMSLTGLTWSFGWYRTGFYKVFGVEIVQQGGHAPAPTNPDQHQKQEDRSFTEAADGNEKKQNNEKRTENGDRERVRNDESNTSGGRRGGGRSEGERGNRGNRGPNYAIWTKVYEQLAAENPNFSSITVQDGSASVSIPAFATTRASDKYSFNSRTGEITEVQLYKDNPKSAKMRGWIYAVHVGSWGGLFTRILYFIACLIATTLPLTGYYIYIKKNWKKKKKKI